MALQTVNTKQEINNIRANQTVIKDWIQNQSNDLPQSQSLGLSRAQPAFSVNFDAITCIRCQRIPLLNISARQCPNRECQAMYCQRCIDNQNPYKCIICQTTGKPQDKLSQESVNALSKLRVFCPFSGCDESLPLDQTLTDHLLNCQVPCEQCGQHFPRKKIDQHKERCKPQQELGRSSLEASKEELKESNDSQQPQLRQLRGHALNQQIIEVSGESDKEGFPGNHYHGSMEDNFPIDQTFIEKLDKLEKQRFVILADHLRVLKFDIHLQSQQIKDAEEKINKNQELLKQNENSMFWYKLLLFALICFFIYTLVKDPSLKEHYNQALH